MAYRLEQNQQGRNDIVIDGFERGIADSPYNGLSSIKNLNIKFLPNAVYVNYKRQAATQSGGTMALPKYWTQDPVSGTYYILDSSNQVWTSTTGTTWTLLSGNTTTGGTGNGIGIYHGYLFVFRNTEIDYCGSDGTAATITSANWHNSWKTGLTSAEHYALWSTDDYLYFCNGSFIGAIGVVTSSGTPATFNPAGTINVNYTFNLIALRLPPYETAVHLAELRTQLLVAAGKKIYPWDRISTSFNNPIPIKEQIYRMINILNNIYVLAGVKGNIYLSNGYSCEPWKKIPDSFFGVIDPQILWGDCMAHRNRLFIGAYHSN